MTKRLVILAVSYVVFLTDLAKRFLLGLVGRRTPGTCVVLMYHGIPVEHRAGFARQMDVLCRIATPLRADSTDVLAESRSYVAVTFDDGLTSFAENALPELEKRNIPATLFVVSGGLGTIPAWTSYSDEGVSGERMLTGQELQKLSDRVLIGSHSITHPMLTKLNVADARREIADSRRQLEELLGCRVETFSFPYGEFTNELLEDCLHAGYERVFSILPVRAFSDPREFVTGRVNTEPSDWPLEFRLKASGSYRWLPYAFSVKHALLNARTPQK